MTNERDTNEVDQLVCETYRELADERTPEHLNRAVLQMAAGKSAQKSTVGNAVNSLFSVWMKPVAWAATIALSLAVVLEFSDLPSDVSQPASPAPATESLQEAFSPNDADILNKAEEQALLQDGPDTVADSEPEIPVELSEFETKSKLMPYSAAAPGTSQPSAKRQRADFAVATDDVAAAQSKSITATASRLSKSKAVTDAANECTPVARLAVQSWLDCIASLRAVGASEAADQEHQLFSEEYPAESAEIEAHK